MVKTVVKAVQHVRKGVAQGHGNLTSIVSHRAGILHLQEG